MSFLRTPRGAIDLSNYTSGSSVNTTGSITSGTATLTVASATSFANNQGIVIIGAGAAGVNLVTTILSVSGTTITLNANASTTVVSAQVFHDDTAGIVTAIAAAGANGVIISPPGQTYMISSQITLNNANVSMDFNGSTIRKIPSFPIGAHALQASTNSGGSVIKNLIIDGNRGADDVQTLSITGGTPTSGTVTLSFGGQTSAAIPFNSTAQMVQIALAALTSATPSLSPDKVQVTGGPWPTTAMTVKFIGANGGTAQSLIALGTNTLNNSATLTVTHTVTGVNNNQPANSYGVRIVNTGAAVTPVIFDSVQVINNRGIGFWNNGGSAELYRCKCDNANANAPGNGAGSVNGIGFYTDTTTSLTKLYHCLASNCDGYGFYFHTTAGENCHLDGCRTYRTWMGLLIQSTSPGSVGTFSSFDDRVYGLSMTTVNKWSFGTVIVEKSGFTSTSPSATGCQLQGINYCKFGTIIVRAANGYGVAVTSSPSIGVGTLAANNQFGKLIIDGLDQSNTSDPGLHLNGAQYNTFDTVEVSNVSYGVIIGEGYYPFDANYNTINNIVANYCDYGALRIDGGCWNSVGRIIARESGARTGGAGAGNGSNVSTVPGLVSVISGVTTANTTNASATLTAVANANPFSDSMPVRVTGAGAAGADLYTTITTVGTTNTFTLAATASATLTGTALQNMATTGNTTNGSNSVTSLGNSNTTFWYVGMPIRISAAGPNGTDLITTITAIVGSTFTIAANASATLTGTAIIGIAAGFNTVNFVEQSNSGSSVRPIAGITGVVNSTILNPTYGVYFDSNTAGNRVLDGNILNFLTSIYQDDGVAKNSPITNGTNFVGGSLNSPLTVAANYTAAIYNINIFANATSGAITVTLPTAIGNNGKMLSIKRINSNANNVTVATTSSQTIDGNTTYVISNPRETITVVSDGTNWQVI
jgi:hypothetical protein